MTSSATSDLLHITFMCWYQIMFRSLYLDSISTDSENVDSFLKRDSSASISKLHDSLSSTGLSTMPLRQSGIVCLNLSFPIYHYHRSLSNVDLKLLFTVQLFQTSFTWLPRTYDAVLCEWLNVRYQPCNNNNNNNQQYTFSIPENCAHYLASWCLHAELACGGLENRHASTACCRGIVWSQGHCCVSIQVSSPVTMRRINTSQFNCMSLKFSIDGSHRQSFIFWSSFLDTHRGHAIVINKCSSTIVLTEPLLIPVVSAIWCTLTRCFA